MTSKEGRGQQEYIICSSFISVFVLYVYVGSRKTSTSASWTTLKPLTMWITTNCGKFLKRWEPDHRTYLLRNLYAGQEATVKTGGRTDWIGWAPGEAKALFNQQPALHLRQVAFLGLSFLKLKFGEIIATGNIYWWRRQWHPTPVLLPGKSHGRRSRVGCSPWGS